MFDPDPRYERLVTTAAPRSRRAPRASAAQATAALEDSTAVSQDGQLLHDYGPQVRILRVQPPDMGGQAAAARQAVSLPATLSLGEQLGADAFKLRQSARYVERKARRPRDGEPWDMAGCGGHGATHTGARERGLDPSQAEDGFGGVLGGTLPGEAAPRAAGAPVLWDSVAVGVIFVNGPTAATRFTAAQRTQVVAEVQAGLGWLAGQNPGASLSWHYEIQDVSISTAVNATASDNESRWRNPVMARLGHSANWQGVLDYVAALRARRATRWAYCVFFVRGYPLDHFGYAGGPRIVMDYANDGWGPDNIDRVFAHETGHIFSCPDEYAAANCSCSTKHGVFDEPNSNCATCAPGGGVSCLMKANDWTMCAHTRRHLGWALGSARLPQGAPVHAVSRRPDHLDIFFSDQDGKVMSAAWNPGMPTWWQGFWHIQGGLAAPGAPVTAVCRDQDKIDIFVVGLDRHVYTAAWTPGTGWHGWWRIGDLQVPARAQVSAVSRSRDKLDIFVTDTTGRVMSAAWEPGFTDGWHGWWHIQGGRAAPGAPVAATVRAPDHLDIFVVGTDGGCWTAAWRAGPGAAWAGWWRVGSQRFPAGAHLSAISRSRHKLDIFGINNGGEVVTAAWQPEFSDGWHGWWSIQGGRGRPGAPVHVVSRAANKLDVFVIGTDGGTFTAAWQPEFSDGWHGWWRINAGRAALGAALTGVSRSANKLDVFVVGTDGRAYTAAWAPSPGVWAGWWPLGN